MVSSPPIERETLTDYFDRARASSPDAIAFRIRTPEGTESLTYRSFFARADRFTAMYRANGMVPGDIVSIVLVLSGDQLCAFAGAVLGGFVPALLPPPSDRQDPRVFWSHMTEMARLAGEAPIVADGRLRGALPEGSPLRTRFLPVPDASAAGPAPLPRYRPAPGDTAFLQYSSGTTGLRKGVVITHGMFCLQAESYRSVLGISAGDRIASWLPLYHDMGLVASFLNSVAMLAPVVMIDPFLWVSRPYVLFEEIADFRATHAWMPNFAFNHLVQTVDPATPYDLSSMKAFVNCSEPCKSETFDRFSAAFGNWGATPEKLLTCYAMAESVFAVTQSPPNAPARVHGRPDGNSLLSVGRLLPGLALRITDEAGEPCPDGATGEIALRGDMVTAGYLNNPEATSAALRGGWYHTGDIGFQEDGELYITGRKKELLIVHGRNYYAHDIEAIASSVPGVRPGRVVAFGRTNAETGSEDLIVVAEQRPADETDEPTLRRLIKAAVVENLGVTVSMIAFVPAGWIVKTTSGKIDRENNLKKFAAGGR